MILVTNHLRKCILIMEKSESLLVGHPETQTAHSECEISLQSFDKLKIRNKFAPHCTLVPLRAVNTTAKFPRILFIFHSQLFL